jgi:hypothetical protein
MPTTAHALFQSLIEGPLLLGDLPEAACFPHRALLMPNLVEPLNLQQKLGHLYEDALAVLLKASPQYDLLARNLQLQTDAHTTVGELDFLIRDLNSGQLIHLELATKFYLAVESESGLTLPGPDARDNFSRKRDRLRTHQLVLTEKFRETLPAEFRSEAIVTRQLIYGCLFDHIRSQNIAEPEFVTAHCRRGRWLPLDELTDHFPSGTQFQRIPKALWPVPLALLENSLLEEWTPPSQVSHCTMLRINDEPTPYFVAPVGYPDRMTSA